MELQLQDTTLPLKAPFLFCIVEQSYAFPTDNDF